MKTFLLALALLAGPPENPSLTLKKPVTVAASFTTLKAYAFSVDFDKGLARTAFQSWDDSAEKHWTGYVVLVDTDEKGSHVTRSDGKKSECKMTLAELLQDVDGACKARKPAISSGLQSLFATCVDVKE